MSIKKNIKKCIKKHRELIYRLVMMLAFIPDKYYLRIVYRFRIGKKLNLDNPQTYNEKLQWLKLYDRRPEYTAMVDKFEAKKFVADKIGEKYIIPTLGVWDKFDDIDFDLLPDQFVLKCTHDSGGLVICKDKEQLDLKTTRKKFMRLLRYNYYYILREWPYKNVKPRIIAEKYMTDGNKIVPEDYKIYCINGEPKYIAVIHSRFSGNIGLSETVYDTDWMPQHFSFNDHLAISDMTDDRPKCLKELLNISKILCQGIPQVRIDFYIIEEQIYFGEITMYPASGLKKMMPEEMDEVIGKIMQLPSFGEVK